MLLLPALQARQPFLALLVMLLPTFRLARYKVRPINI
jgi:hypothetical protein